MPRSHSVSPGLEFQRKQAKALLKAYATGDLAALDRFRQHHPRLAGVSPDSVRSLPLRLADAQLVLAREHGYESWPKFAKHLQETDRDGDPAHVWVAARDAVLGGDAATLERLLIEYGEVLRKGPSPAYGSGGLSPDYSAGDARAIIAREHHFANWGDVARFLEARSDPGSPIARFEAAVEAIVAGDAPILKRLLRQDPSLIRERSLRAHHSTLLHYVGANGVESFRQRTPKNAVEIAAILLDAGAEIDAVAEMYGGSTTLGLVATSVHPALAGVQHELIDYFLERGAGIDLPGSAGNEQNAVNGCLANGRGAAAEHLARRGARLDLEGAAGVGALDLVRGFFNENGSLLPGATEAQLKSGFNWACEYGRLDVAEFLLPRGIDLSERHRGETGLHWAAYGGHAEVVRLLLKHGAPVDVPDEHFDGTPLGWALYGWAHPPLDTDRERYYEVVALLVAAGATVEPESLADENVRAEPRMLAALAGQVPGPTRSG